jgi:hypothetical protein
MPERRSVTLAGLAVVVGILLTAAGLVVVGQTLSGR